MKTKKRFAMTVSVLGLTCAFGCAADDVVEGGAEISCTSGVIAKCVAWGYEPWTVGAEVHQTCTRLARADYCGDGRSFTENGTQIDVWDDLGVLDPEGGMEFEAGWGPDGAVCVNHPRYLDVVVGEGAVFPSCWDGLPACESDSEAAAFDATLVNASTMQGRSWCEAPTL